MLKEIEVGKLNPAPYNPRVEIKLGTPEWEKLQTSIEQFGNVEPVVWNQRTGNVVGGHQRLKVLKYLGYTAIPCSIVDLSSEDEKVLNIALNKIKGRWDYEKLADLLGEFDRETATASGFSEEEIAILLSSNDDIEYAEDWEGLEDDIELAGASYTVTLEFQNSSYAAEWARKRGLAGHVKENKRTTVIRIEDLNGA